MDEDDNVFFTNDVTSYGDLAVLLTCSSCSCLVAPVKQQKHREWHMQLNQVLKGLVDLFEE